MLAISTGRFEKGEKKKQLSRSSLIFFFLWEAVQEQLSIAFTLKFLGSCHSNENQQTGGKENAGEISVVRAQVKPYSCGLWAKRKSTQSGSLAD